MAEILPFAASATRAERPRGGSTGEIIIFPGVRVEYHDHPPQPPAKQPRRGKRDGKGALSA